MGCGISLTTSDVAACSHAVREWLNGRRVSSIHGGGQRNRRVPPADVRSIHCRVVAARAARVECRSDGSIKFEWTRSLRRLERKVCVDDLPVFRESKKQWEATLEEKAAARGNLG